MRNAKHTVPNANAVGAVLYRADAGVFGPLMQDPQPRRRADPGVLGESIMVEHTGIMQ